MSNDFDPSQTNPYATNEGGGGVPVGGSRENALAKVKTPAVLLMITGILSIFGAIFSAAYPLVLPGFFDTMLADPNLPEETKTQLEAQKQMISSMAFIYYGSALFGVIGAIIMCIGASNMMKLKSYGMSMAACIVAICPFVSPCCGCIFPIVIGIWGIVVISGHEVKPYFE